MDNGEGASRFTHKKSLGFANMCAKTRGQEDNKMGRQQTRRLKRQVVDDMISRQAWRGLFILRIHMFTS